VGQASAFCPSCLRGNMRRARMNHILRKRGRQRAHATPAFTFLRWRHAAFAALPFNVAFRCVAMLCLSFIRLKVPSNVHPPAMSTPFTMATR